MKNKIIVLVISIIIAIIVLCVGIFGTKKVKSGKNEKVNGNSSNVSVEKGTEQKSSEEETSDRDKETQVTDKVQEETTTEKQEETTMAVDNHVGDYNVDPSKPMVALTFDDGPGGDSTIRILDALKAHNGRATFFLVGYNIDGHEDIIKRAAQEGNEIGNHTASHQKLTAVDDATVNSELDAVDSKIKEITGESRVIIRPPYGAVDDRVMQLAKEPIILWSVDTEDWKTRDANSTIANVQANVYDGAIILMHDIYGETADAAVSVIEWLDSQGYQMVTVSELGYYRRGGLQTGIRYGSLAPN